MFSSISSSCLVQIRAEPEGHFTAQHPRYRRAPCPGGSSLRVGASGKISGRPTCRSRATGHFVSCGQAGGGSHAISTIRAVYQNGVFRPMGPGPIDLPESSVVEFEPRPVEDERESEALDDIYEVLSRRFHSGRHDLAERHNERRREAGFPRYSGVDCVWDKDDQWHDAASGAS